MKLEVSPMWSYEELHVKLKVSSLRSYEELHVKLEVSSLRNYEEASCEANLSGSSRAKCFSQLSFIGNIRPTVYLTSSVESKTLLCPLG